MRRRLYSFVTALVCLCALLPAAFAASDSPTPPGWIPEKNYVVLPGDEVYQSENWAKVLSLRAEAEAGAQLPDAGAEVADTSAGMCYETGLLRLRYAQNAPDAAGAQRAYYSAYRAFSAAASNWKDQNGDQLDSVYYALSLWSNRAALLYDFDYSPYLAVSLDRNLTALGLTLADFYDAPYMDQVSDGDREKVAQAVHAYQNRVALYLDGHQLFAGYNVGGVTAAQPEIRNNRTMIPIRTLAEHLGADVEWVQETSQVVMTRAGVQVIMTLNQTTATVDGKAIQMDVAPYAADGRTLIPARYVAEFFDQSVTWDAENRRVDVQEDKTAVGDSNLEAWALPMGAMLSSLNAGDPSWFGLYSRGLPVAGSGSGAYTTNDPPYKSCRRTLSDDWGIDSREALITTVCSMTLHGHNDSFQEAAGLVNGLSASGYQELLNESGEVDRYMWPQTKALSEKWWDRGILCWDLFRMSNLVQWGYEAGYLTYPEALALLEPAAVRLKEAFSSWDEAYENYLDGYNWWARNDMTGQSVWETSRGKRYLLLKESEATSALFDDALFSCAVLPVPGLSAASLSAALSA